MSRYPANPDERFRPHFEVPPAPSSKDVRMASLGPRQEPQELLLSTPLSCPFHRLPMLYDFPVPACREAHDEATCVAQLRACPTWRIRLLLRRASNSLNTTPTKNHRNDLARRWLRRHDRCPIKPLRPSINVLDVISRLPGAPEWLVDCIQEAPRALW